MKTEKKPAYDLIVFGATAFTGRLAAAYLSKLAPGQFRWALSGRDKTKLDRIFKELAATSNPPSASFQLDHSDAGKVREVVAQTGIAISFAGPFNLYGENIVATCAELGVHYLDITGETPWIRKMIDKYEPKAKASGAILIPFSGFDSVPSDLGVWLLLRNAKDRAPQVTKAVGVFSGRGGLNGGTFATMLSMLERGETSVMRDPALLIPEDGKSRFQFADERRPIWVDEDRQLAPPFFMSLINSRTVYRSQYLRAAKLGETQAPFPYFELQKVPARFSGATSRLLAASSGVFESVGRLSLGRQVLKALGPKPGQGPSEEVRENGFFKARFFAYAGRELVARSEMSYPGDPGNKATVLIACESALCLALDAKKLTAPSGGFWTPSTALGPVLAERLRAAGVSLV